MKARIGILLALLALVLAGCGSDDGDGDTGGNERSTPAPTETSPAETTPETQSPPPDAQAPKQPVPAPAAKPKAAAPPTSRIALGDSQFGKVLFDGRKQAIYAFELDGTGAPKCYGSCAEAWPPVTTKVPPVAAAGVKQGLLGTVKRTDGTTQVTYAGRPLYYYAHEAPGEVKCHNIVLDGGTWWALAASGENAPT